jgi:tRNA A37 threonylcarbamoyladenosine dehydratase
MNQGVNKMLHAFSRAEMLIGAQALQKLKDSKVAVFGIGGVGAFAVEALTRSGVGSFVLIDDDVVCLTNLNRQLQCKSAEWQLWKEFSAWMR